jgi:hypothetical protein
MCNCKDCKGITLLSGTDGRGIVSITYNEETHAITVLYTDGTSYTSPSVGCDCPENVFYSEEILGPESVGEIGDPIIIDGTTYTVPVGGDGTYRILYTSGVYIEDVSIIADLIVKLLINGTPHPISRFFKQAEQPTRDGISLNYQVDLVEGDVINFQGESTVPGVHYLTMAVMIIDKMP